MADGAATLRTTMQALQDGLISDSDYDRVKQAFLKAQQFKAGLDAGFLGEDDYEEVKRRFLDAFYGLSDPGEDDASGLNEAFTGHSVSATGSEGYNSAAGARPEMTANAARSGTSGQPSAVNGGAGASPANGRNYAGGNLIPSNIPSLGGTLRKKTGPQTSMSGIAVSDDAINLFYYMKAKSAYRWAMWGINNNGSEIVIVDVGDNRSSYQQFVEKLPENDCRFAVYDYQVTNSEGRVFQKLVFVSWSPDAATIRTKMMYASSKDFLKSHMEGLAVELQVSEKDELEEEQIHEHVLSVLTRK